MIKAILHFLKIHRKMILGNTAVVVQDMLGKTPKSFDAVNVIFRSFVDQCFRMIHLMMLSQALERIVASKRVRVVDRSLPRFLSNDRHKFFFGYMLYHARIDLAIALEEAKNNILTFCSASALTLASATEVALVHLYITVQFSSLKFGNIIDRFLIDARNRFVVETEIMGETVRRLLLVEALHDRNFCPDSLERFLFSTAFVSTSNVAATRLRNFERTAENAFLSPQKVGRATKNVLLPLCHMDILVPYGYETH